MSLMGMPATTVLAFQIKRNATETCVSRKDALPASGVLALPRRNLTSLNVVVGGRHRVMFSATSPGDAMYSKILVAIDDGPSASHVLDEAIGLAAAADARLRVLHVMNPVTNVSGFERYAAYAAHILPHIQQRCTALLSDACRRAAVAGVDSELHLYEADRMHPWGQVLEVALAWHPDLIVMGTHCRHGGDRLVMGNEAEWVVRKAKVPVLLVGDRADASSSETAVLACAGTDVAVAPAAPS